MCEWSDVRGWKGSAEECTGETLLLFSLKFTVKSCGSRGGGNRDALLDFFLSAFFFLSPSRLSVTEKRKEALTGGNAATEWMREMTWWCVTKRETGTWAVTPSSFPRDDLISAWWSSTTTVTSATTQRRVYNLLNTWEVKLLPSCSWKKRHRILVLKNVSFNSILIWML